MNIPYKNLKYYTFAQDKKFTLENGQQLGPIDVAYETFGALSSQKDNAVLIIHALTGDTHVTSAEDENTDTPGWWDTLVGCGKSIDTNTHFVICANVLGGCMGTTGPSSINPETGKPYGQSFPLITIHDMVAVQKKLIEYLGITKLKSIVGGSLGGMATIEWMRSYPDDAESYVVIAASYKTSSEIIAFYEIGRNAILADPDYNHGNYYDGAGPKNGLAIARMIAHVTYLSTDTIEAKFGRNFQKKFKESNLPYGNFGPMFAVESYLRYQGGRFVERFDANSYLYITKAMDIYDATYDGRNSLKEIFSKMNARCLFVAFKSDWHFVPEDVWQPVKAMMELGKDVTYVNLDSTLGHDAFLIANEEQEQIVAGFLSHVKEKK